MKTLLTSLAITTFALHAALAAPQEIPKSSKLRAQLFDLARPTIEKQAGQAVKFAVSQRQLGDWAFFNRRQRRNSPSLETGKWSLGISCWRSSATEPFHLEEWPRKYGAPLEVLK